jgi:hypothetical protein
LGAWSVLVFQRRNMARTVAWSPATSPARLEARRVASSAMSRRSSSGVGAPLTGELGDGLVELFDPPDLDLAGIVPVVRGADLLGGRLRACGECFPARWPWLAAMRHH